MIKKVVLLGLTMLLLAVLGLAVILPVESILVALAIIGLCTGIGLGLIFGGFFIFLGLTEE